MSMRETPGWGNDTHQATPTMWRPGYGALRDRSNHSGRLSFRTSTGDVVTPHLDQPALRELVMRLRRRAGAVGIAVGGAGIRGEARANRDLGVLIIGTADRCRTQTEQGGTTPVVVS